jgi:lysine 6-dehydrogenase
MPHRYGVIGAGRQGVAAAYDLARFGDAEEVVLGDISEEAASDAAERLNHLTGRQVFSACAVDARDSGKITAFMRGLTACIASVHFTFNLEATRSAIEAGVHLSDLGGNTDVVREQLKLDDAARRVGVSVVPDCGMGPGLNISLGVYAMSLVEKAEEVLIWDGGLPQKPEEPWNYASTFHIDGLTNELYGHAMFIRDGRVTPVPCFDGLEELEFPPPIGRLEAFVTSGGLSVAPWTFERTLTRLENKTLRYPGFRAAFKAFSDLGLFEETPVRVSLQSVVPRNVFHALLAPRITRPTVEDVCVIRAVCKGGTGGGPAQAIVELVDWYDPRTGFTAMQRLTGWHASIVTIAAAQRRIAPGVISVERCLPGAAIVEEVKRRGIAVTDRVDLA